MKRQLSWKRRGRLVALSALCACAASPTLALAAESAKTEAVDPRVAVAKYLGAAIAMVASALGAAYAQAKIGSAAAGTLAENPEAGTMLIVLQALPEIIVLLGFVSALIISG